MRFDRALRRIRSEDDATMAMRAKLDLVAEPWCVICGAPSNFGDHDCKASDVAAQGISELLSWADGGDVTELGPGWRTVDVPLTLDELCAMDGLL